MNDNKNFIAFTLAEVLITLVIIGIIAAITVPSLIAKYKEQELKTQFKKTYSTLAQALNKTYLLDFNSNLNCYWSQNMPVASSDCHDLFDNLSKHLNTSKICENNAKENGCVPKYSSYNNSSSCIGFSEEGINTRSKVYILTSGQIIILYGQGGILFLVDINGFKPPNKPGYDLFSFQLEKSFNKPVFINKQPGCDFTEQGGKWTTQMMKYAFNE